MLGSTPGWPAVLADGPVLLRPYRRGDARAWSDVRIANQKWLAPWESSPPGPWAEMNSTRAYLYVYRDMKRAARRGDSMPFAVCLRDDKGREQLVGHINLGNIVRRAFGSAYVHPAPLGDVDHPPAVGGDPGAGAVGRHSHGEDRCG